MSVPGIGKVSKLIAGETKTGQTMLFPSTAFKISKAKPSDMRGTAYSLLPPFKPTGVGRPAPGSSARLARTAEVRTGAAKNAIAQSNRIDDAAQVGQITNREMYKQNRILMKRRKRAGI
jgi:hypothetical protein